MPKIKTEIKNHNAAVWARQLFNTNYLRQRELGLKFPMGHSDRFFKSLYTSIQPVSSWDHHHKLSSAMHGGVFNLEYSPDGSLLLAACEKKSILMFDPLCRKLIHTIDNAHDNCVNGARFLDQRMFATCSDDSTVALWDARNLKQRIRTLHGHSNWVKNIEYSPSDKLLLTSGFDGVIFSWDINSFTENSCLSTRVFQTNGLMRTRLTPDASKMLMCTTSGYLIIVHNLNLSTLSQDLAGFKPNMYRLMQLSQTSIPAAAVFTHLFSNSRNKNRVEFVTDFPEGDDAEVISSLQVHPHGWCALSRNVSNSEKSEWTCVHDIQECESQQSDQQALKEEDDKGSSSHFGDFAIEEFEENQPQQANRSGITSAFTFDSVNRARIIQTMTASSSDSSSSSSSSSSRGAGQSNRFARVSVAQDQSSRRSARLGARRARASNFGIVVEVDDTDVDSFSARNVDEDRMRDDDEEEEEDEGRNHSLAPGRRVSQRRGSQSSNNDSPMINVRRRNSAVENGNFATGNVELHVNSSDVWEALVAIREARLRRESEREFHLEVERRDNQWTRQNSSGVVIVGDRRPQNQNRQGSQIMYAIPRNHRIHQNAPRLTHYIEEPNVGSGYIKELCFSSDGRLICSPFAKGIRLLAFSNQCQELADCVPRTSESSQLIEVATNYSHNDIVVSTKFSPRHCLLVSGCLSGRIVWYQPVL
ncbi:DDB1- and CUL4-associated factor 10 isoform X2 [Copidosoma floridanum]|uniref:DDB1- and CUL4-associated factor 10 isoform X2 n=1 Tax=Copidosoma floridanum TaxID=29053 RepID=UPI0006C961F6|nr:DDB1- and CUL4-associated factor 10 isoform X2 [Copidosoma floridanum]